MSFPFVSIIMPVLNEEKYIINCIESVLANDYPKNLTEILIIDGMSSDRTIDVIQNYVVRNNYIRILSNPKKIQAVAMNIGLREAKGNVIIRMDAHTIYAQDYIRKCVDLLQIKGAENVGGLQRAVGTNYISKAISLATTTPFGIGNAHFRYANKEMWVDTVYLGAWKKDTLEALGGFKEEWAVNEDYELNYRLRKSGGMILLSPEIMCWYYVRPSMMRLSRQYFRYGSWRAKTAFEHPSSLRWRQIVPAVIILCFLFSFILSLISVQYSVLIPGLYLCANLLFSIGISFRFGMKYVFVLPIIFISIHFSYGAGSIVGLIRWGVPKIMNKIRGRLFKEKV